VRCRGVLLFICACGSSPAVPDAGLPPIDSGTPLPSGPITVVQGAHDPYGLAVDDLYLYYTSVADGSLNRTPKLGGAVEVLATGMPNPYRIVLDDSYAYVMATGTPPSNIDGMIVRIPRTGGTPVPIATNLHNISNFALDGSELYFVASGTYVGGHYVGDGEIDRVPKDGSAPPEALLSRENFPAGLALDATSVYFTAQYAGTVVRCDKASCGTTRAVLFSGLDEPLGITFVGSMLVFAEYHGSNVYAGSTDGALFFEIAGSRGMPYDVISDGTRAFWDEELTREVQQELVDPNAVHETLATAEKDPTCLALDAHGLYFSDEHAGTITRIPR
jgi:hypothetical protein